MKTTPAIEALYSFWFEASKVRPPDDTRHLLCQNEALICEGLEDACRLGVSELGSSMLVHLLDCGKALVHRSLLVRRRLPQPMTLTDKDLVIAFSDPALVGSFFSTSDNTVICYLYTARDGQTWAIVVAKTPGNKAIRAGQHELVSRTEGPGFLELLRQYSVTVHHSRPDFALQSKILTILGAELVPFLAGCGVSGNLHLIPHSVLNVLPVHAAAGTVDGHVRYIDELFRSIGYSTCLPDLVMACEASRSMTVSFETAKVLAVLDLKAADLSWIADELENWNIMKLQGLQVDIATNSDAIPPELGMYSIINVSCHAKSDPRRWGASCITIAGRVITAADIAQEWGLNSAPLVTLAACETALDSAELGFVDEYSGLDLAMRVAGARAVYATMWPVSDAVAALAAMVMPVWVIAHGASPGQALVTFQRSLREGRWTEFLPTDTQLSRAHPVVREKYRRLCDKLRSVAQGTFRETAAWAVFRCCGA